jgi:ATP adenylyltransferase
MQEDEGAFRTNHVLVMQPHAIVCLNKYPFASSHLLINPRRHVSSLEELPEDEYLAFASLLREATIRLRAALKPDGLNVGMNIGRAAGAGIKDHVHCHIIPRWDGDTNFLPVIGDVRVMPEYLDDSWRRLYPHFADLPGQRAPAP